MELKPPVESPTSNENQLIISVIIQVRMLPNLSGSSLQWMSLLSSQGILNIFGFINNNNWQQTKKNPQRIKVIGGCDAELQLLLTASKLLFYTAQWGCEEYTLGPGSSTFWKMPTKLRRLSCVSGSRTSSWIAGMGVLTRGRKGGRGRWKWFTSQLRVKEGIRVPEREEERGRMREGEMDRL